MLHNLRVTPADLRLSDNDLVQLVVPFAPPAPAIAAPVAPPAEPQVLLELQDRHGHHNNFRIRMSAPFSRLIDAFAKHFKLDPKQISHLEFDGEKLEPDSTPAEMEMEDEFVINVLMKKK